MCTPTAGNNRKLYGVTEVDRCALLVARIVRDHETLGSPESGDTLPCR